MGRLKKKSRLNPPSHQLSLGRIPLASLIQTLAVAEHLSFYRAAQALGTSQSNVSARIKALEQDLGILLFERNTRGVRLTEAGRLFVERVAAGVDQLDHAVKTAGMAASGECGRLRVGIHALMPRSFLAELIAQFREDHPGIDVEIDVKANTFAKLMKKIDDCEDCLLKEDQKEWAFFEKMYNPEETSA